MKMNHLILPEIITPEAVASMPIEDVEEGLWEMGLDPYQPLPAGIKRMIDGGGSKSWTLYCSYLGVRFYRRLLKVFLCPSVISSACSSGRNTVFGRLAEILTLPSRLRNSSFIALILVLDIALFCSVAEGPSYNGRSLESGSDFNILIGYGSSNRNLTPGDAICHCHLYPHFTQGMWESWRVGDASKEEVTSLDSTSNPLGFHNHFRFSRSTQALFQHRWLAGDVTFTNVFGSRVRRRYINDTERMVRFTPPHDFQLEFVFDHTMTRAFGETARFNNLDKHGLDFPIHARKSWNRAFTTHSDAAGNEAQSVKLEDRPAAGVLSPTPSPLPSPKVAATDSKASMPYTNAADCDEELPINVVGRVGMKCMGTALSVSPPRI